MYVDRSERCCVVRIIGLIPFPGEFGQKGGTPRTLRGRAELNETIFRETVLLQAEDDLDLFAGTGG